MTVFLFSYFLRIHHPWVPLEVRNVLLTIFNNRGKIKTKSETLTNTPEIGLEKKINGLPSEMTKD